MTFALTIGMLSSLQNLTPSLCVMMLKCIKNISMNSNTLDVLQNASAINTLVQVLGERTSSFDTVSSISRFERPKFLSMRSNLITLQLFFHFIRENTRMYVTMS